MTTLKGLNIEYPIRLYNANGNQIYYEDSDGNIKDKREPEDMTMAEIIKKLGRNIRIIE